MDVEINIVKLDVSPNQELIDNIKKILKEAESGALRSCVAVCQYNNKDTGQIIITDKNSNIYSLIGGLEIVKNEIVKELNFHFIGLY